MKSVFLLLLFCHVSSPVPHSVKFFITASSGVPNIPEFVADAMIDDQLVAYCDSNTKKAEPRQDWVKMVLEIKEIKTRAKHCGQDEPNSFKIDLELFERHFNLSGGVHILQSMRGSEWDDETGEVNGFVQYAYDGEDFMELDFKTSTWITKQQGVSPIWNSGTTRINKFKEFYTSELPGALKKYWPFGKNYLQRTDLPTVSLLQKTPSSPVSCHATGFYPNRAVMFWRKDGEDLHEGMEHSEILPNHDRSFQMSVDLKVSPEEDWKKYQCVFQLSGVKEDLITELDKAVIRTNWKKQPTDMTVPITAAVVVVALVLIAAAGFKVYRNKKAQCPPSDPANGSELSDPLNQET